MACPEWTAPLLRVTLPGVTPKRSKLISHALTSLKCKPHCLHFSWWHSYFTLAIIFIHYHLWQTFFSNILSWAFMMMYASQKSRWFNSNFSIWVILSTLQLIMWTSKQLSIDMTYMKNYTFMFMLIMYNKYCKLLNLHLFWYTVHSRNYWHLESNSLFIY